MIKRKVLEVSIFNPGEGGQEIKHKSVPWKKQASYSRGTCDLLSLLSHWAPDIHKREASTINLTHDRQCQVWD